MSNAAALQWLALAVVCWLVLAVGWLNLEYHARRKRMTDAEKLAYDQNAEADTIIW